MCIEILLRGLEEDGILATGKQLVGLPEESLEVGVTRGKEELSDGSERGGRNWKHGSHENSFRQVYILSERS
jgi:hypothetical protein